MWSLGCVLYSLATYKFGRSFPPLAEQLSSPLSAERTQQDIRAQLRDCGYSKEFLFLVMALLSVDEATRPSSRVAHRMFLRDTNGALGLKPNPAAAAEWKSMTAFSESSTK
jgi:serine/threonine protein kinase